MSISSSVDAAAPVALGSKRWLSCVEEVADEGSGSAAHRRLWPVSPRRHAWRQPLQCRIALLTFVSVALATALSSVAWYLASRGTLVDASQSIAEAIAYELRPVVESSVEQYGGLTENEYQLAGVIVEAVRNDGSALRVPGATPLVLQPGDLSPAGNQETVGRMGSDASGAHYVMVSIPLSLKDYVLIVARPMAPIEEVLDAERWILLGVDASVVTAAALIGGLVARSAMRPVHQLTDAVQYVAKTTDFQPVAIPKASSDLAALAAAFNEMLQSLATMRERQNRLIADAGHELRTPLTSISTNIDLLVCDLHADHLTSAQKSNILADVRAQLGELCGLTRDLIRLTRDDAATLQEVVDLHEIVESAVARVRGRAQGHEINVSMEEFYVFGDAESLERAVSNLLDNAVKWSPPAGTIWVRLVGNRLSVVDSGPGIPEVDRPFVFDRFFRGEAARHTPGTGLGLSIVAKTVEEHGGTVAAGSSEYGGAELTLELPGARTADALTTTRGSRHPTRRQRAAWNDRGREHRPGTARDRAAGERLARFRYGPRDRGTLAPERGSKPAVVDYAR